MASQIPDKNVYGPSSFNPSFGKDDKFTKLINYAMMDDLDGANKKNFLSNYRDWIKDKNFFSKEKNEEIMDCLSNNSNYDVINEMVEIADRVSVEKAVGSKAIDTLFKSSSGSSKESERKERRAEESKSALDDFSGFSDVSQKEKSKIYAILKKLGKELENDDQPGAEPSLSQIDMFKSKYKEAIIFGPYYDEGLEKELENEIGDQFKEILKQNKELDNDSLLSSSLQIDKKFGVSEGDSMHQELMKLAGEKIKTEDETNFKEKYSSALFSDDKFYENSPEKHKELMDNLEIYNPSLFKDLEKEYGS